MRVRGECRAATDRLPSAPAWARHDNARTIAIALRDGESERHGEGCVGYAEQLEDGERISGMEWFVRLGWIFGRVEARHRAPSWKLEEQSCELEP